MMMTPGQEDDEGVEVEVGLALGLRLVIRPDHRQHRHALNMMIYPILTLLYLKHEIL